VNKEKPGSPGPMPCLLSAHRREDWVKDHTSVPDILSTAENLGISGHSTRKIPTL
jgi:hypothetical protein